MVVQLRSRGGHALDPELTNWLPPLSKGLTSETSKMAFFLTLPFNIVSFFQGIKNACVKATFEREELVQTVTLCIPR